MVQKEFIYCKNGRTLTSRNHREKRAQDERTDLQMETANCMELTYLPAFRSTHIHLPTPFPLSLFLSMSGLQPWASTINAVIKKEAEREEAFTRLESALYLSFHPSLSHNPPTITPKCFHSFFPNSFPIYFYASHCYVKNTSLSAIFGDGTVTSTCIQVQNLPFLCILNASNCV